MKTPIAIIFGYSLVILANLIWYRSKFILKKKVIKLVGLAGILVISLTWIKL